MSQESKYSPYKLIALKRDGHKLQPGQIQWLVKALGSKEMADYQMSALLMAIYINGMDSQETAALTDAMLNSGEVIDFGDDITFVDKHSTGGVGDKASFILAPIASSCGVKVPMMAGRGLGHTGGTIDKAESIEGFQTSLSLEKFAADVQKYGLALTGQTEQIAPADKTIYALRDVTATIESIPLITASIMSKKLAEGANGIIMDIKVGSGAFMKTIERARELAESLRLTAKRCQKSMITVLSDMDQPLGQAIGNSLEIIESIQTLKGKGPEDLTKLSTHLAAGMIFLANKASSMDEAKEMAHEALQNGKALQEFRAMIERQGGNPQVIDKPENILPLCTHTTVFESPLDGFIYSLDCQELGMHCVELGGGRRVQTDKVDPAVGLIMHKKLSEKVKKGDKIVTIHHHEKQQELVKTIKNQLKQNIIVKDEKPTNTQKLIIETMSALSEKRKDLQC